MPPTTSCRIVVLISGNGSNLQAIIDALATGQIPASIVAVISNKADAYGLQRARKAAIPSEVVLNTAYADRQQYDQALMQTIDQYQPDLIVLAGFMRILGDTFVEHYYGRMINIHPSLLPKYKGLNTHQRVLQAGEEEHGASVHFVVPELDSGPVILQGKIPVLQSETEQQLIQRIHAIEHKIYPRAIQWFAMGRLSLSGNTVLLDKEPIRSEDIIYSEV